MNEIDMWIDAIPEDPYAPCPCGCGTKWKFAKQDMMTGGLNHEELFYKNILTQQANNDMVIA